MPIRLRRRVLTGMTLASLFMVLVAIAVLVGTNRFLSSIGWVEHTQTVLRALDRGHSAVKEAEASQRGFIVTGQVEYEQEFYAAIARARDALAETHRLVADSAEQAARVGNLSELVEQRLQVAAATAQAFRSQGYDAARRLVVEGKGRALMRRIDALRAELVEAEQLLMTARQERAAADAARLRLLALLGLAAGIGLIVFTGWRMSVETRSRERAEARTQDANVALHDKVDELRLRASQTREMSRYAGMLQSCRNTTEAIAVTRDACQRLLPDLGGAVYLVRASQDLVEGVGIWGSPIVPSASLLTPQECWALRRGRTHEVADVHAGMTCAHVSVPPAGIAASYLCVPLTAQGDVMGFLHFSGSDDRAVAGSDVAVAVGEQLSLALSNLRLQESLRVQSIRDPLTGLFNRRYLEESLERELARCLRRSQPLAVLMIDLDHFKRFNDTHGHDGGDALLSQVGRLLQGQSRGEDIACRFGGEEFTLILPEMDAASARERAEHVRRLIEGLQVWHLRETLTPVTASIGFACCPDDAREAADLLRLADMALYRAKHSGRNRVVAAADAADA